MGYDEMQLLIQYFNDALLDKLSKMSCPNGTHVSENGTWNNNNDT
jgi:hypothetical protein